MSLLREIMGEAQGIVNDALGHACELTNSATQSTQAVNVVITGNVELYQQGQFAGIVTTGVFDRAECAPLIGDTLADTETGIEYSLDGIKEETPSKLEFILGEL